MSKKIEPLSIIIPHYSNTKMLMECIGSIGSTRLSYPVDIIVVNNGHPNQLDALKSEHWVRVVQTGGRNLGWEGGLIEGMKHTNSEFVMFCNDDIYVPQAQANWIRKMMEQFRNPDVAGVGPSSNFVMGPQHMTYFTNYGAIEVSYLIGFCVIYRRKVIDEVGGVDFGLPGGDDLDLSMRIRAKGHRLVCQKDVFVFHYGSQTGVQLHGGSNRRGGWNSPEMTERTNMALIKKNGFRSWFECIAGLARPALGKGDDHEGQIIRKHIVGDTVLDLGCANNKTIPTAIGVDIKKKGDQIPFLNATSEADVVADVEDKIPYEDGSVDTVISRHILEHCIDLVKTLSEWRRVIKKGGRLIVAVPNESILETIPLNGEHVHAFTEKSLTSLLEMFSLKPIHVEGTNGASIVCVSEAA